MAQEGKVSFIVPGIALCCIAVIFLLALGYSRKAGFGSRARTRSSSPIAQASAESFDQPGAIASQDEDLLLRDVKKICFYRDGYVYLYDVSTKESRQILKGSDPDISPEGTAIAFTDGMPRPFGNARTIKALDLEGNRINEFQSLVEIYSFSPRWSHNGNKLAFDTVLGNRPHVGIIDSETGAFEDVSRNLLTDNLRFDSWLDDDKSVICHDLENIYEIALDGRLLQTIPIRTIIHESDISTGTRFCFSPDRRYLLFDGHREPENEAIYLYSFESRKLSAITPETIDARGPVWLPSGKAVMFSCITEMGDDLSYNICTTPINGTHVDTIIGNAAGASYSK